jgi:hypothetical protein
MVSIPSNVETAVKEVYTAHYLLTNLGFEPDNVFVSAQQVLNATPPGLYAICTLKQGDKQFVMYLVQLTPEEGDLFRDAWAKFCVDKRSMSAEELDALVHSSELYPQRLNVITALGLKGFDIQPGRMTN